MSDENKVGQPMSIHPTVETHLAAPKVSNFLVTFFINVFLPILPGLLLSAAPIIQSNSKFQTVLKEVDKVIDQLIGEQP